LGIKLGNRFSREADRLPRWRIARASGSAARWRPRRSTRLWVCAGLLADEWRRDGRGGGAARAAREGRRADLRASRTGLRLWETACCL